MTHQFHTLPESALPAGAHEAILRSLYGERLRRNFFYVFSFLGAAFLLTTWHAFMRMGELESITLLQSTVAGFELTFDFLKDLLRAAYDVLPLTSLLVWLVNLTALACMTRLYTTFNHMHIAKGRAV